MDKHLFYKQGLCRFEPYLGYSSVAQLEERSAVNGMVAGSSPAAGVGNCRLSVGRESWGLVIQINDLSVAVKVLWCSGNTEDSESFVPGPNPGRTINFQNVWK